MENIYSYDPLWSNRDLFAKPAGAIKEIRVSALIAFLERHAGGGLKPPSIAEVIRHSHNIIEYLLWDESLRENPILRRLRQQGQRLSREPLWLVQDVMAVWYKNSAPVFARDPFQGFDLNAPREYDSEGHEILTWSSDFTAEHHEIANLGLMAILLTDERWAPPAHPTLQMAGLIANTVTAVLYATFLISPRVTKSAIEEAVSLTERHEVMRLYLKTAWHITQAGSETFTHPPASEFSAIRDELRISKDGKRLLTRIGFIKWEEASFWHPCRKVPGSAWNKVIRSTSRPVFGAWGIREPEHVVFSIPSSALTLTEPWEFYYSQLKAKLDQSNRPRHIPNDDEQATQFSALARRSGRSYPSMELSPVAASWIQDVRQEYLYVSPLIKKPIIDLRGDLALPFITTTLRAMRHEEEPDEVEPDFAILTFVD